jgi:hypothetical protein
MSKRCSVEIGQARTEINFQERMVVLREAKFKLEQYYLDTYGGRKDGRTIKFSIAIEEGF